MREHEAGLRKLPVPALVAVGVANWMLIAAGIAGGRSGYHVPVAIGAGIFITLAALVCRAASKDRVK